MISFLITDPIMDHPTNGSDLLKTLKAQPNVTIHESTRTASMPDGSLPKDIWSNRLSLALPRPLANPELGMTVIRYSRGQVHGGKQSIERQRQVLDAWFDDQGVSADEDWIEFADGTKANVGIEGILRRAESGEVIWLVMADATRVTRNSKALGEFLHGAQACGMQLSITTGMGSGGRIEDLAHSVVDFEHRHLRVNNGKRP